ncbi:TetR family transcriptional regulator [Paraburkholderia sp. GAS32]|uniref:TetR family transcriptional regulator n=1 Tax=Paraburkholderia sp. GAS32 TaxID=3035129 RepID=UPI003D24EC4B
MFLERRVDAVGLTELPKVAGFTQGAVYIRFASKDALVLATANKVSNTCLPIIGATLILAAPVKPAPET